MPASSIIVHLPICLLVVLQLFTILLLPLPVLLLSPLLWCAGGGCDARHYHHQSRWRGRASEDFSRDDICKQQRRLLESVIASRLTRRCRRLFSYSCEPAGWPHSSSCRETGPSRYQRPYRPPSRRKGHSVPQYTTELPASVAKEYLLPPCVTILKAVRGKIASHDGNIIALTLAGPGIERKTGYSVTSFFKSSWSTARAQV